MPTSQATKAAALPSPAPSFKRSLVRNYDKIRQLSAKIRALNVCDGIKPSLMRKMLGWIAQLAKLREKETQILNKISEIENRHHALRQQKRLYLAKPLCGLDAIPLPKPKRKSMMFDLLLLWVLFRSNKRQPRPSPQ